MADETVAENATNDVAAKSPPAAAAVKKTRAPRRPKVVAEAAPAVETVSEEKPAKKVRAKRGSKLAAAPAEKVVTAPKKPVARVARSKSTAPAAASAGALDDIADLIKLEQENKQLRQQLSEKLRAENADLRKRLGQG